MPSDPPAPAYPAGSAPPGRPKIREILSDEELKGMAATSGLSLDTMAKVLAPISGMSAGLFTVAASGGEALGKSMGFSTGKTVELTLACSYPSAVRAVVFALSAMRYQVTSVFDTTAGAYVEAAMPGDFFAAGGTLKIDLLDADASAKPLRMIGATEIKGQVFDWGKSKRALAELSAKVEEFARRLG